MIITREQREQARIEQKRLADVRKELGRQIHAINTTPMPERSPGWSARMSDLARKLDTIKGRQEDVQAIIDAHNAQIRAQRERARRESLDPEGQRKQAGQVITRAARRLAELTGASKGDNSDDASLIAALRAVASAGGYVQRMALVNDELTEARRVQAAEIAALRQQVAELQARESGARRMLRVVWEARYDEVDTFRIAHGVRYRVHITEDIAARIQEVL